MNGVCSIDLQCSGVILSKSAQLVHDQECHELSFVISLECAAHDAHLRIDFSWWSAADEVGVCIPAKVN